MTDIHRWLILRIFHGNPLKVANDVASLGIEPYCPRYTVTRRHPFNRRREITVTRPLLPGYLFTAKEFDADRINRGNVKARFMCFVDCQGAEQYLRVPPQQMELIRVAEHAAQIEANRPTVAQFVRKLTEPWLEKIPQTFTRLGDVQTHKGLAA